MTITTTETETLEVEELLSLNDRDYRDELRDALGQDGPPFTFYLQPRLIRRTEEALDMLAASLNTEILLYGPEGEREWLFNVARLQALAETRLAQTRRAMASGTRMSKVRERKWKEFAHALCAALDASDNGDALDDIAFPFAKDMTAWQWLTARRDKDGSRA